MEMSLFNKEIMDLKVNVIDIYKEIKEVLVLLEVVGHRLNALEENQLKLQTDVLQKIAQQNKRYGR